jgi:capsular polysaccharide transport system permease protein
MTTTENPTLHPPQAHADSPAPLESGQGGPAPTSGNPKALVPRGGGIRVLAKRALGVAREKIKSLAPRENRTLSPAEIGLPEVPRRPGFLRRHFLFLLAVAAPTLLSILYFGPLASDVYVSESSYVVRSPSQKSMGQTGLGALLQGATGLSGFARAPEDVHTVADYIESEDAVRQLDSKLDVRKWWSAPSVDILQRFDPFGWNSSIEELLEYYPGRVDVLVDDKSGITKLTVTSFSPEQALAINSRLLAEAEGLVNALNNRGRTDLIRFAQGEVAAAEDKAKAAAQRLSEFRNNQAVVDPEKQTLLHFEQIARLQEELIKTRGQLTQLKVFAPDSPHPPALQLRAQTLEAEIAAETAKITGGENSLASKASEYQRLQLEREFADRQLAVAMAALEAARNEAQRQQLYLETINKPDAPDHAAYPKRLRGIFTTFLLGLIAWGILGMLIAGVREHQM